MRITVAGSYLTITAAMNWNIYKNGVSSIPYFVQSDANRRVNGSATIDCNANDKLTIVLGNNDTFGATDGQIYFEQVDPSSQVIAASDSVNLNYQANTGQSIPTGGSFYQVDFNSKVFASHDGTVTTGASWKFTAPISGTYSVTAIVRYANGQAWTLGGYVGAAAFVDGVAHSYADTVIMGAGTYSNAGPSIKFDDDIKLRAGQTLDIRTSHGESSARLILASGPHNRILIKRTGNY